MDQTLHHLFILRFCFLVVVVVVDRGCERAELQWETDPMQSEPAH
jgi:hypothetical protein